MGENLSMNSEPAVLNKFFFYQVGNSQLIGSENPFVYPKSDELLSAMIEHLRISVLVSLAPVAECVSLSIIHYQYVLPNDRVPTIDEVRPIISALLAHIRRGEVVWCHCQRGLDRTGCILGGLLTHCGFSAEEATRKLLSQFPHSRQSSKMKDLWKPYAQLIGSIANDDWA